MPGLRSIPEAVRFKYVSRSKYPEEDEMFERGGKALLLMGCPEVPVQTSIALYLCSRLRRDGWEVLVAGTGAALKLLEVADPERHYLSETMNLDDCIAKTVEGEMTFDICFVFMHSDAGVTYGATIRSISSARIYALIYGRGAEEIAEMVDFDCERIAAKAVHNPAPLKAKIDKVMGWAA